ncbi:hypothetical protein BDV95DRAFT_90444 [Massariosphaeria phaeospora]|uniref:Uncharacterized protein n=1 Tax=Massariosphaeria phaeospora TaxID=100035 RepID=A0A7C8M662_9PLEO|nr:hypothetical protein BDV95DRAFT_90444 [Massariosphaeria phaeospora]
MSILCTGVLDMVARERTANSRTYSLPRGNPASSQNAAGSRLRWATRSCCGLQLAAAGGMPRIARVPSFSNVPAQEVRVQRAKVSTVDGMTALTAFPKRDSPALQAPRPAAVCHHLHRSR